MVSRLYSITQDNSDFNDIFVVCNEMALECNIVHLNLKHCQVRELSPKPLNKRSVNVVGVDTS